MIKNTAGQVISFSMFTPAGAAITSGTVSPYVTVDGGTQAAGAGGAPQHEGNGQWTYTPTQDETNGVSIGFIFIHASGVPVNLQVYTLSAAVEEAVTTASASSPPLSAHMTELEAVNMMLRSIGEAPVSTLTGATFDAQEAQAVLREESRRIQAQGWHSNTRRSVSLSKNASNQFAVGVNVLSIDTVNPDSPRRAGSPRPSSFYDVSLRRAADNSVWLLYDVDNDKETWTAPDTLTVDIVEFKRFENLPTSLQVYIYNAAGKKFQKGTMSSRVLNEFTDEDVQNSLADALQEDTANEDRNMLRDNASARQIVQRFNPLYGS